MIKRILVPLDPSPYSKSALNLACIIAKVYDAELTGLVILDIPGIEDSIGPVPIGGLYYAEKLEKEKKEEAQKRIDGLLKNFKKKCEKETVNQRKPRKEVMIKTTAWCLRKSWESFSIPIAIPIPIPIYVFWRR